MEGFQHAPTLSPRILIRISGTFWGCLNAKQKEVNEEVNMGLVNTNTQVFVYDPLVVSNDSLDEVLLGLQGDQKTLPARLFYDQRGSLLFDQICGLDEYYLTRTETAIMQQNIQEIAEMVGSDRLLIEYGSGSSMKTRYLLDYLPGIAAYVPVDISRDHLYNSTGELNRIFPELQIIPLWADYTKAFTLPRIDVEFSHKLAYFPGSTLGNFCPEGAIVFMQGVAELVGPGGGFLIGIDLQKDPDILNLAYNDRKGVTAAFNLNMLSHINREYHADFKVNQFEHHAFYNQVDGRIEMHLISNIDQIVTVAGAKIGFRKGESILTEVSYKFTTGGFAELAALSGFHIRKVWVDPNNYFSVQYLVAN
jgi:dimethylhistidine N-methyltransferase